MMRRLQRKVGRYMSSRIPQASPTEARLRRGAETTLISELIKKEEKRRANSGEKVDEIFGKKQIFPEKKDDFAFREYNQAINEIMNLVNIGASSNAVRAAISILEKRHIITRPGQWIRVLQALSKAKDGQGAAELLKRIPGGANTSMHNVAIRACARAKDVERGREIFELMEKSNSSAKPDSITFATAMALEPNFNDRALQLFRQALSAACTEIEKKKITTKQTGAQLAYREAFSLCNKGQQWRIALDLLISELGAQPANGAYPQERDVEQVAQVCSSAGQRAALVELLQWAAENNIDSDKAHAAYIHTLANAAAEYRIRSLADRQKLAQSAITALQNLRKKRQKQRLEISAPIGPPSSVVTNAALRACALAGAPDLCLQLFQESKTQRDAALDSGASYASELAPDFESYLWTMRAMSKGSIPNPGDKCLDLLADAAKRGISPNPSLCAAVLEGLALQANSAELASELIAEMDQREIKLTANGVAALVRCLAKSENRPDAAIELFHRHMNQYGDSSTLWIAALDANRMQIHSCKDNDNAPALQSALNTAQSLVAQAPQHCWVQVAVARVLAATGDWESVCSICDEYFSNIQNTSSQDAALHAAYSAVIEACFVALEEKQELDNSFPMLDTAKQFWIRGANLGIYSRPSVGKRGKVLTLDLHGTTPYVAKAAILATFDAYYKEANAQRIPTLCLLTGTLKKNAILRPAVEDFLTSELVIKFKPAPKNSGILVIGSDSVVSFNNRPSDKNYPNQILSPKARQNDTDKIVSLHDFMTQPPPTSNRLETREYNSKVMDDDSSTFDLHHSEDSDKNVHSDDDMQELRIEHIDEDGSITIVDENGISKKLSYDDLAALFDDGKDDHALDFSDLATSVTVNEGEATTTKHE
uniref:Smr domain-containing protein n=1 Tax=Aureoumbra lagunensis TaxID=44058 RepID=A0A7S3K1D3_9STRA